MSLSQLPHAKTSPSFSQPTLIAAKVLRLCFVNQKALASGIALICWVTFAWTISRHIGKLGLFQTAEMLSGYFTYWSLLATAGIFSVMAFTSDKALADRLSGAALMMTVIMSALYWPIAGLDGFLSAPNYSKISHTVVPLSVFGYFFTCTASSSFRIRDAIYWTESPLMYTFWNLLKGYRTGSYPYAYTDVGIYGYKVIIFRIICVTAGTVLVGLFFIALKKNSPSDARFSASEVRPASHLT